MMTLYDLALLSLLCLTCVLSTVGTNLMHRLYCYEKYQLCNFPGVILG